MNVLGSCIISIVAIAFGGCVCTMLQHLGFEEYGMLALGFCGGIGVSYTWLKTEVKNDN